MPSLAINSIPLLGERSGVGRYTWEIASRLAPAEFAVTCFYGGYSGGLVDAGAPASAGCAVRCLDRLKTVLRRHVVLKRAAKSLLGLTAPLVARLRNTEYDLYFEPNFILQPGIQAKRRVITVHDFSCLRFPHWHPAERVRLFEKDLLDSLAQADRIITVSEAVRREAIEDFGLLKERVVTIHNGVDHSHYSPPTAESIQAARQRWALPEHFVLSVGTLEPRKNLGNLLLAHAALPTAVQSRYPLVLAGGKGWEDRAIQEQIQRAGASVILLGFVPEAELPALYGAATLLAYPSWYEGFGLPVLEAMACGCPVVTSTAPALMEVSGDAALCVSPDDVQALSESIAVLLENEAVRYRCTQKGLRRAAQFTWESSAAKHVDLFRSICEGNK